MCEVTQTVRSYPIDKNYLVIGHCLDGAGDISCAVKVATILNKRFLIPIERIEIATNNPKMVEIFNKRSFKVLSYAEAKELDNVYLQIAVPAFLPVIADFIGCGIPTLLINEYGFKSSETSIRFPHPWLSCHSFGLNLAKRELGIIISPGLVKHAFSQESLVSLERLKHLEKVKCKWLSNAILNGKSIGDFDQSCRLYQGYTSKSIAAWSYIGAICLLNQQDPKDLIFVMPGTSCCLQSYLAKFKLDFNQFAVSQNIKAISFISEESKAVVEVDPSNAISVTIIYGSIEYRSLKKVLLAAEKETITTGDQSLSEDISCNKSWQYEMRDHKFALASDLADIASAKDHNLTVTTDFVSPFLEIDHCRRIYSNFLEAKKNDYVSMSSMNKEIIDNFDAMKQLPKLIDELTSRSPSPPLLSFIEKSPESYMIPFNQWVVLNLEQILALKIDVYTRKSSISKYQDSEFSTHNLGELYFLQRISQRSTY